MLRTDAIIIGAGQAGLAASRALSRRGIEHVVLERGRVGERWRSERWDSLRLLTTASQSTLPGLPHAGVDPEHFMPAGAFADYLGRYARALAAPVVTGADVVAVDASYGGYQIATSDHCWYARSVIVATGACDMPYRPAQADNLPSSVTQISPANYRAPEHLPDGGVLVVGASSSGVQIAEELHASGRPVTIAVGEHTRMVRRYRGRDIFDWMETAGILDDPAEERGKLSGAPRQPSMQLVGRSDHRNLDLSILEKEGVRILGRLSGIDGSKVYCEGDLEQTTTRSQTRLIRTLQRIDCHIEDHAVPAPASEIDRIEPIIMRNDPTVVDLRQDGIKSVVWATGYRRRYGWLNVAVVGSDGEIVQRGGVTPAPGLYVLGLQYLRRRRSHFINGCARDAEEIAQLVAEHLNYTLGKAA